VQCSAVQHSAVLCSAAHSAVLCSAAHSAVLCSAVGPPRELYRARAARSGTNSELIGSELELPEPFQATDHQNAADDELIRKIGSNIMAISPTLQCIVKREKSKVKMEQYYGLPSFP
jgi:hypothetical protein